MEIYALVGPSGTGKSHHATELADELQISYIIDDGLLIHNGKKLAGVSAKSEPTMVAAVKRAIMTSSARALLPTAPRKISRTHAYWFGELADLDLLLTTNDIDPSVLAELREAGLAVAVHEI